MRKILSLGLCFVLLLSLSVNISAKENSSKKHKEIENQITFSTTNNEKVQKYEGIDKEGNEFTVTLEEVSKEVKNESPLGVLSVMSASSTRTWKVKYTGIIVNMSFYMDVSNNAVVNVYDERVLCFGSSSSGTELKKTSTYGRLSTTVTSWYDVISAFVWIKGTVTGLDNKITLTFS
ncbi:conserved exported protein of unknown function [Petrocella atlantisensis]|uniref:DUF5626 domain-containing protein n=1 Tax=Petrocella atlantisensis TaxID=2173034 RepID=A0A3P7P587_9FIRM|nr:DUF5626 family protein [Petrocella atlantisensis]VDN48720.1 conserved exported protein of unknown function [Petrocella atlantisensis]